MPMMSVRRVPTTTLASVCIAWFQRPSRMMNPRQIAATIAGRLPDTAHAIRAMIATMSHQGADVRKPSSGLMTRLVRTSLIVSVMPWKVSVIQLTSWLTGLRNEKPIASGKAVASTANGAARPIPRMASGAPRLTHRPPRRDWERRERGSSASPAANVSRSSKIARITIAMPESKAEPTSCLLSAWVRDSPSPGAPMSPVITIIDSPSMIVWLIASGIAADAEGRDPDGRRDRKDKGCDRRGRRTDQEEEGDRRQVGERRHDLHDVEDRRQDCADPIAAAGYRPERQPDPDRDDDRGEHHAKRRHALVP